MPNKDMRSIKGGSKGRDMYEAIRREGHTKESAAKITNAKMGRRGK